MVKIEPKNPHRKPFTVGDEVSIIRHRHGWSDGNIKGTVATVNFRTGGAAHYSVIDANGQDYTVYNTKDLHPLH